MHKNLKKIINLALIGAISSNNIVVFADNINPKQITQNNENLNTPSSENSQTNLDLAVAREGTLEISLKDGEHVQDLSSSGTNYLNLVIKTTGDKQLDEEDYANIKKSQIPNIDLSGACSSQIPVGAFKDCTFLETFKFPQGLTSIGDALDISAEGAFSGCTNLTGELIFPNSLKIIGNNSFNNCSNITGNLVIPESVTTIGRYAFNGCSKLTGDLTIPNSVVFIGDVAFQDCSGFNGKLTLPNSITNILQFTFNRCSGLTGDLIIPNSVISIESAAFQNCSGFNGKLVMPNSVKSIEKFAFNNCSGFIGDLVIPDSIKSIKESTFSGCSGFDGKLILPNSILSIESKAFNSCKKLTGDLILSNSLTNLGSKSFENTNSLNKVLYISNSNKNINDFNLVDNIADLNKVIFYIDSLDTEIITNNKLLLEQLITLHKDKLIIELPYGVNLENFPLKEYTDILKYPTLSILDESILDNPDNEIYTSEATLSIPIPYDESDIKVTKNNEPYKLPNKNNDGSYIFKEVGLYKIDLKTKSGTASTINFEVVSFFGTITINHINNETGEVLLSEIFDSLKIGTYKHNAKEIQGYTLKDDSSKVVNITKENRNQTIIFKYSKNAYVTETPEITSGSVIIKHIDSESGKELLPSESITNIKLGKHTYTAQKINGYSVINNDSISVELTKENPNQTITFTYKKNKDTVSTVDKDTISSAADKGFDLLIISNNGTLKVYNSALKNLKDKVDSISIDIQDVDIKNSSISTLLSSEKLNLVNSFTAYSNLSELKENYKVSISKSIDEETSKTLHLYKINEKSKSESLQYIGECNPTNGLAKFDIDSQLLDGSTFVITYNKRTTDVSTNTNGNNNTNTNNNTNNNKPNTNNQDNNTNKPTTNTQDKNDTLPNSSGLGNFAPLVAITSILFGLFTIFKKKK